MLDPLIKNGTVVDGSGTPRRTADVAVQSGRIAEIAAACGRGSPPTSWCSIR